MPTSRGNSLLEPRMSIPCISLVTVITKAWRSTLALSSWKQHGCCPAAQWRAQQRAAGERPRLIIREAVDAEPEGPGGLAGSLLGSLLGGARGGAPPAVPMDIRERTAAVLERARGYGQEDD